MPMIPKLPVPDHDPKRDLPRDRKIKLANNTIHIMKDGPSGFWRIHYDKGQIPEVWKGDWMTVEDAKRVIKTYLWNEGREAEFQGQL